MSHDPAEAGERPPARWTRLTFGRGTMCKDEERDEMSSRPAWRPASLLGGAVLMKELRTRMRGWRAPLVITLYLLVLALIAFGMLQAMITSNQSFTVSTAANTGVALFTVLSLFQMLLLVFITPASTATAISGERQRQTLDLLLVTRLSSTGIVLGKLVAALSFDLLLLLCALPLFSLVFLFGGVAPEQLAEAYVVFFGTTLVLGTAGLCISTLTRRSGAASVISNIFGFILTLGLALITAFVVSVSGSGSSGGPNSPLPQLPVTAYIDPLFALLYILPGSPSGGGSIIGNGLGRPAHGPFGAPLELWQYNLVVDLALAALFVLVSVIYLRPRGQLGRGRRGRRGR